MASLNDEHDRCCLVCPAERVVGRRVQAALAASILALTSLAPAPALAQQAAGGSAESDTATADFDPGGESDQDLADTPLEEEPSENPTTPQTEAAPPAPAADPGPVIEEPAPALEAPEDDSEASEHEEAPISVPAAPAPTSEPPAAAEPAPAPVAESESETADVVEPRARIERPGKRKRSAAKPQTRVKVRVAPTVAPPAPASVTAPAEAPVAAAPAQAAPAPRVVAVPTKRVAAVTTVARPQAKSSGEWHVVKSGESLWSIAQELLGSDASTKQIAREVNRLWELNQARIGTGDRNVLMAGTRLKV